MCGIVGYIGNKNTTRILIDGLRRLEYRGYDSAGIAVRERGGLSIVRTVGKLSALVEKVRRNPPIGHLGIGHTRWATHGSPSEVNAHPHKAGPVVLVHNGIIENYQKLRHYLTKKGHTIKSETDTELICHLIQQRMYDGLSMAEAFQKSLSEIEGSYALAVMNENESDRLYVARNGSPLVIGLGKGENFVASDIPALLPYTHRVLFLEDGDSGILWRDRIELQDAAGNRVLRPQRVITWNQAMAEKGGYKHFMLKEIFEQPRVISDTLSGRLAENSRQIFLKDAQRLFGRNGSFPFNRIYLLACGTSYHAALAGKYYLEEMARLPVVVDQASEFRYRNPIVDRKSLVIGISQSGETADTLAALKLAKAEGAKLLSICNVVDSSIPRLSDVNLYTRAGPEIGVASTKAFTTQLVMLLLLALYLGKLRGMPRSLLSEAIDALAKLPKQIDRVLKNDFSHLAAKYALASNILYFGRGVNYPIALEGALKLKEISYIHAEGYSAGEMKHGPIALVDKGMPVVALVPQDRMYDKVMSNIEEVRARGADVIALATQGDKTIAAKCRDVVFIPKAPWYINPILMAVPLQLLAYQIADHKGTDVDQPRNLAKSVTVE